MCERYQGTIQNAVQTVHTGSLTNRCLQQFVLTPFTKPITIFLHDQIIFYLSTYSISIHVSIFVSVGCIHPLTPPLSVWHPNDCYLLPISSCFSQACQGWSLCPQTNPLSLSLSVFFIIPPRPFHAVGWERIALHRCLSLTLVSLSFYAAVWHFLCVISSSLSCLLSVVFTLSLSILFVFSSVRVTVCTHTHTHTAVTRGGGLSLDTSLSDDIQTTLDCVFGFVCVCVWVCAFICLCVWQTHRCLCTCQFVCVCFFYSAFTGAHK